MSIPRPSYASIPSKYHLLHRWAYPVILVILLVIFFTHILNPNDKSISPFRTHFFTSSRTNQLYDIDIGTLGRPIGHKNDTVLLTFDPFDKLLIEDKYERHPYLISDFDGTTSFYINHDIPGCSSINHRNWVVDQGWQKKLQKQYCGGKKSGILKGCMEPKRVERKEIRCRRLSTFVTERDVRRIKLLKIDAQGSDFTIVKDLFENAPNVWVDILKVECQKFNETVPLYFASNDCDDIVKYVKQKESRRIQAIEFKTNNCLVREYNLVIKFARDGKR